jgi:geranylgeranyl pyrophosphate synthase
MDDDDFRRGKPSCHKKYGEAAAILAGDALLTLALSLPGLSERERGVMNIGNGIAEAAFVMVSGQHLDMAGYDDVNEIYMQKTAALIQAAAATGAMAAKGSCAHELTASAHNFGMAFQYKDDFEDGKGVDRETAKERRNEYRAAALAGFKGLYGEDSLPYLLASEILR